MRLNIFRIIGVLVLGLLLSGLLTTSVLAATPTIYVEPGESIQAAVDSASAGQTIIVKEGTYNQTVIFGLGQSGIILKSQGAILDGLGSTQNAILIDQANGVVVTGFFIKNYIFGVVLEGAQRNSIIENTVSDSGCNGIVLQYSRENLIKSNTLSRNNISMDYSSYNKIISNSVSNVPNSDGIALRPGCSYNQVNFNVITSCYSAGIALDEADRNQVNNNTVTYSQWGIVIQASDENLLASNDVSYCDIGIQLRLSSSNNLVTGNVVLHSSIVDLEWDGTGTGNLLKGNKYNTSNP